MVSVNGNAGPFLSWTVDSFNTYFLSISQLPGTMLGAQNTWMNMTAQSLPLRASLKWAVSHVTNYPGAAGGSISKCGHRVLREFNDFLGETWGPNSNPVTETSCVVIHFSWEAIWVINLRSWCLIAIDISRSLVVMANILPEGPSSRTRAEGRRLILENMALLPSCWRNM